MGEKGNTAWTTDRGMGKKGDTERLLTSYGRKRKYCIDY
jgi:hypothetical protein